MQKGNTKTHFEANEGQRLTIKHSNIVRVAKKKFLNPLSVTKIIVTTRTKGFVHFDRDLNLFTKGCLPAKGLVEAISNTPFFILVTKTNTKEQHFD